MRSHLIFTQNDQDYLAEKAQMLDNHITHASKIAFLKVQSLKFAIRTPEVGFEYLQSVKEMVKTSLLANVPNTHVLSEEGFYFAPLEN